MPNAAPRGQFESASRTRATGLVSVSPSGLVAYRSVTSRQTGLSYHPRADWISIPNLTPDPGGEFDVIAGSSLTPVTGGTTIYLGLFGNPTEGLVSIPMPACTITELRCRATAAPGSGKSFTYTLRKNAVDQGSLVVAVSGTGEESSDTGSVSFSAGDKLSVKLVTDSGAGTAHHLWSIKLQLAS